MHIIGLRGVKYSNIHIHPGYFRLGWTDYSTTQRRRAEVHITYDCHISKRESLIVIFSWANVNIEIFNVSRAAVIEPA